MDFTTNRNIKADQDYTMKIAYAPISILKWQENENWWTVTLQQLMFFMQYTVAAISSL